MKLAGRTERISAFGKKKKPSLPVMGTPDSGQEGLRGRGAPTPGAAAANAGSGSLRTLPFRNRGKTMTKVCREFL